MTPVSRWPPPGWPPEGFQAEAEETRFGFPMLKLRGPAGGRCRLWPPARPAEAASLVIVLHGAGGDDGGLLKAALEWAAAAGAFVIAPRAAESTWDVLRGGLGRDLDLIDAIAAAFARTEPIDPGRIALAGFSDGAAYALTVGLKRPGVFRDVIAFAPGFFLAAPTPSRARFFIAHGRNDAVIPHSCGAGVAAALEAGGVNVSFHSHADGHSVPKALARLALNAFDDRAD